MHVPEHVLDPATCLTTGIISTAAVAYGIARMRSENPPQNASSIGLVATGIFAAQSMNFPIAEGTSGHVLGGLLAAIILGPWSGLIAMTLVLLVQCLVFQDGGLAALGANVLNMGVAGSLLGFAIYSCLRRAQSGTSGAIAASMISAWLSVQIGAILCSLELAAGGGFGLSGTLGTMLYYHSLIGLGEAFVTGVAVALIIQRRRGSEDNLLAPQPQFNLGIRPLIQGIGIVVVLAMLSSPFTSSMPDGLEATISNSTGPGAGHRELPRPDPLP